MNNYTTWLNTYTGQRALYVEVDVLKTQSGVFTPTNRTTLYFSTHALPINGAKPVLNNTFSISSNVTLDYTATISYGDIELMNSSGELDYLLNSYEYLWVNAPVRIYYGPSTAASLSELELIFVGIVEDIDAKSRSRLALKIRDKLEYLNVSITDTVLGNYYHGNIVPETTYINQNKDAIKPLVFGEVFNITPLSVDPTTLEYMVCDDSKSTYNNTLVNILDVRDNGVPVGFTTAGIRAGSFKLLKSPVGTITCSVQGIGQVFKASEIVNILATQFGKSKFVSSNIAAYNLPIDPYIGIYITSKTNLLQTCQEAVKCGNGVISASNLGGLTYTNINFIAPSVLPGTLASIGSSVYSNMNYIDNIVLTKSTRIFMSVARPLLSAKIFTEGYYCKLDLTLATSLTNLVEIITTQVYAASIKAFQRNGIIYIYTSRTLLTTIILDVYKANNTIFRFICKDDNVVDVSYSYITHTTTATLGTQITTVKDGTLDSIGIVDPVATIDTSNTQLNTFTVKSRIRPIAGTRLGYSKNWTVQDNLKDSGIPDEHRVSYGLEWLESLSINKTQADLYNIATDLDIDGTHCIDKNQAESISLGRLIMFGRPSTIYTMTGIKELIDLSPGDPVLINQDRFNLVNTIGMVLSTQPDYAKGTISLDIHI